MLRTFQNLPGAEPCAAGEHGFSTILWLTLISSGFLSIHLSAHLFFCTSPISALTVHVASLWHHAAQVPDAYLGTGNYPPIEGLVSGSVPWFRMQRASIAVVGAVVVKVVAEVAFSLKSA